MRQEGGKNCWFVVIFKAEEEIEMIKNQETGSEVNLWMAPKQLTVLYCKGNLQLTPCKFLFPWYDLKEWTIQFENWKGIQCVK